MVVGEIGIYSRTSENGKIRSLYFVDTKRIIYKLLDITIQIGKYM